MLVSTSKDLLHTICKIESVSSYSGKWLKSHDREESSSDSSSDSDVPMYTKVQVYTKRYSSVLEGCEVGEE